MNKGDGPSVGTGTGAAPAGHRGSRRTWWTVNATAPQGYRPAPRARHVSPGQTPADPPETRTDVWDRGVRQ
ncbi:hypothetical protein GCM10010335_43990 [Streptomyces galbus]|nr:hypothetical protein GCM10010335_43990 [Streptomyces galbus]